MTLYRHYKQKYYRYRGSVRHSETREDLVLYETRYDSPGGRVWVRPREMFFESVLIDGKLIPRFQEVPLEIHEKTEVSLEDTPRLRALLRRVFGPGEEDSVVRKLENYPKLHFLLAQMEGRDVGFKLGYARGENVFYSWLGGVDPDFRGLGIASELMRRQHHWCREQGYTGIQTKTQNRFREMLLLNLRHGFDVVGTQVTRVKEQGDQRLEILLEKNLVDS